MRAAAVLAVACAAAACSRPHEPTGGPPELPLRPIAVVAGSRGLRHTYKVEGGSTARAAVVIEARLARLLPAGTAHVAADGERVVVDLPAADAGSLERLADVIAAPGSFAVHEVALGNQTMGALLDHAVSDERAVSRGVGVDHERWSSPDQSVVDDRFLVASDRAALEAYVAEATADAALRLPTGVEVRTQAVAAVPVRWRTFAVVARPTLDSAAIRRTSVRQLPAGDLVVELALDDAGRKAFAALTRQLVGQKLALIVDGVISSAPIVMGEIAGGKLYVAVAPGDQADGDALRTAEDLAVTLGSGPLPGRLLLESSTVAPD
ncbi:MAG TPA: hypothetical protein VMZ28_27880 [Kofleriaceae bacterium]|nr:hypothetical protein [Kofleriaceae bacterium]